MTVRLRNLWDNLRSSFWFIPALMMLGAAVLSQIMVQVDASVSLSGLPMADMLQIGSPDGARSLMSAIAGSMITVAGVVFSITIVVLSLASSQFGPRLLRNFMQDRDSQAVLGTFVATFVYCLLILRSVRGGDGVVFIPHLAIVVGFVFALFSIGVLIFFIHHMARAIQAPVIVHRVGHSLKNNIEHISGLHADHGKQEHDHRPTDGDWWAVIADDSGYVQDLDTHRLIELAAGQDGMIRVLKRPGDFVIDGVAIAEMSGPVDDDLSVKINATFVLGWERTTLSDLRFGFDQLAEIAARALSPGINDPYTAADCVNQIGDCLRQLLECGPAPRWLCDDEGEIRLKIEPVGFADALHAGFASIRNYAGNSPLVLEQMLAVITELAALDGGHAVRARLLQEAEALQRAAGGIQEPIDQERIQRFYEAAQAALGET